MFTKGTLNKYAQVLLWGLRTARQQRFKKQDIVLLRYHRPALPLAEVLYRVLIEEGFNPVQRMVETPTMEQSFFELANARQLVFQAPGSTSFYRRLSGTIYLHAPESLTHLSNIDLKSIGKAALARKPLRDILDKREERGELGWTLCAYPTPELARHAKLSLAQYEAQIKKACFLNTRDPVAKWQEVFAEANRIKQWLNGMEVTRFHIESANTDLWIAPGQKRKWIGVSGHNIPSFELFISPDYRGTQGVYYADQPSYRSGNCVEGLRLEFKNGRIVKLRARKGRRFAQKQFAIDRGASRVGEFSLTDKRFSKIDTFMADTLFDENYGGKYGNCHIALGAAYSATFDGNPARLTKVVKNKLGFNDSALHWDIVNTEQKRVTAVLRGGQKIVIYENGKFKC